jgi:hypothetical protein
MPTPPRSFEEIRTIAMALQANRSPVIRQMQEIQRRYEGDYVVPLPEMADEPRMPPLTPALVANTIDSTAQRATTVLPNVECAALDPTKMQGTRSREYAVIRRKIISATYHHSRWRLKRRRYYRHLAAYQTCSVLVLPDHRLKLPRIEVRDPLFTFVEERSQESQDPPGYVCFITRYSSNWLRNNFRQLRSEEGGPITEQDLAQSWDVVEWLDNDQTVFGLIGPQQPEGLHISSDARYQIGAFMQLGPALPNPLGYVGAMVPANIGLGSIGSRMGSMLGMVDLQAKLMALDILAQEKAIFPDVFAISRAGEQPRLVDDRWHDGREGQINIMEGAERIGVLPQTPDVRTAQAIDRLERNWNVSHGNLPQFGGETYGALRTGRGIDALAGIAVDPRIQELHEITEDWMPQINRAILDTYKTHWGAKKYELFSGWPGDHGTITFTPNKHIETNENVVRYPVPGADIMQLTQILGSLAGTEALSIDSLRERHPWIPDGDGEKVRVVREQLEKATRMALEQQLITGQMPISFAAKISANLNDGYDLFQSIERADQQLREEQASQVPEPPPGMQADPSTMPGLAAGPAAALGPAGVPGPAPAGPGNDAEAMRQLLGAMGAG